MGAWMTAPGKAAARAWQVQGPPARKAVFMPGWDEAAGDGCACVREGLRNGLVGPATQVVAVERDQALAPKVRACLEGMGLAGRVRMHGRGLSLLRLDPGEPVDFAFIDLLGNLEADTAAWMRDELAPALAEGASLALTFAYGIRKNLFMARCLASFEGPYAEHARQAAAHFGVNDRLALAGLLVTMSALRGLRFTFGGAVHYQDGVRSMVAYRLDAIGTGGMDGWPSLTEIAGDAVPRPCAAGTGPRGGGREADPGHAPALERLMQALDDVPRTLAGRRPAHVAAADRMALALGRLVSGYEAASTGRSEAAHKAWATRRARGWTHPRSRHPADGGG